MRFRLTPIALCLIFGAGFYATMFGLVFQMWDLVVIGTIVMIAAIVTLGGRL